MTITQHWFREPIRRQAIIWTNADLIHWRMYAALGGDELMIRPPGTETGVYRQN